VQIILIWLSRKRKCRRFRARNDMEWDEDQTREYLRLRMRASRMLRLAAYLHSRVRRYNRPILKEVEGFESWDINFESFTDIFFDEHLGFTRAECEDIYDTLAFPERLVFHGDTKHQFSISGPHCFLYFLYHVHTTEQRQSVSEEKWGYDYSTLSKMYNGVMDWLDEHHCFRLNLLPVEKFPEFNRKIKAKIVSSGYPIPPEAMNAAVFLDGIRLRCAKAEPQVS
jgi:hypothetical protein